MKLLIFITSTIGCYVLLTSYFPQRNHKVKKAVIARGDRQIGKTEEWTNFIAAKIIKYIELDEIRKIRLQTDLYNVDSNVSAEMFVAKAVAKVILLGAVCIPFILFVPMTALPFGFVLFLVYRGEITKMDKQIKQRKLAIERELPQFAGTIRQSLSTSRSVVAILESYRKVCGAVLRGEIDKTLNDMKMGNDETALKSLDSRINSAKMSELIRGLISVLNGEDQRIYFEMLTHEYIKAENENVRRALQERPIKLKPYTYGMLGCMMLMIFAGMAFSITQQQLF